MRHFFLIVFLFLWTPFGHSLIGPSDFEDDIEFEEIEVEEVPLQKKEVEKSPLSQKEDVKISSKTPQKEESAEKKPPTKPQPTKSPSAPTNTKDPAPPQEKESPPLPQKQPALSESLAPQTKEKIKGEGFFSSLENHSWIWDSKKTRQELVIIPTYFMSNAYGANWGLRWLTFPTQPGGYYFSVSVKNQIFSSFLATDGQFRKVYQSGLEIDTLFAFNNYFEPYFGEGIQTRFKDRVFLHSNQFSADHQMIFKQKNHFFYGVKGQVFFRKERPVASSSKTPSETEKTQTDSDQKRLSTELLFVGRALVGHDSRDHWANTKTGQFHTLSLGCVPSLGYGSSFCLADLDLRSYFYVSKHLRVALRGFLGTTLIAPATYSLAYQLGGTQVLRGFTDNRFRGDKIYFTQAELRSSLWKEILSGILFAEMGEVASYDKNFVAPRWDYGLGLRIGLPPSYDMKVRVDLGFSTDPEDSARMNLIVHFHHAF